MKLTIAISKGEEFYVGTILEIPGVITQGEAIEETRENIMYALQLYLDATKSESSLENVVLEEYLELNYARQKN